MKSKHIIIITLLIPFILILLWFGMKIKPLPDYNKITEYSSEEFSFYGDDATLLPGEYIIPETISSKRSIFLIADQKLDRNWNSRNMEFQTGRKISHILGQNGIPSVIYDQRGTGESVLSGKNHPTPENLASDFHIIYKKSTAKNFIHSDGIEIIAHGHSCIPALLAVNQFQIPVQRIYLLSCVFPGTLLDSWLEQILNNMRRAGVDDTAVSEGETIIQKWKKQDQFNLLTEGETNASADQKNQDIQSLYRALDYMQSEQMLPWTNQAKNISFLNEINKLEKRIEVIHLINEYDEEFAENLIAEWKEILEKGQIKRNNHYTFKIIPQTDHFFMHASSRTSGVMSLIFHRINPWNEMDLSFMDLILNP